MVASRRVAFFRCGNIDDEFPRFEVASRPAGPGLSSREDEGADDSRGPRLEAEAGAAPVRPHPSRPASPARGGSAFRAPREEASPRRAPVPAGPFRLLPRARRRRFRREHHLRTDHMSQRRRIAFVVRRKDGNGTVRRTGKTGRSRLHPERIGAVDFRYGERTGQIRVAARRR